MSKKQLRMIKIMCIFLILVSVVSTLGIAIAHNIVFARVDYDRYDSTHHLLYSDLDQELYSREEIQIQSGDHALTGYLYDTDNANGLIIISPGHTDANDIKLYEIMYFVDRNWKVLCYDYTGSYRSQGDHMIGYTQSVHDLDAVLTYVEASDDQNLPIMLFGHSLGGFASAAVLSYGHDVDAAIIASGFDTPKEQWSYSIEKYTGFFSTVLKPFTNLFLSYQYGEEQSLSAIDGINAVSIPILVISGNEDAFYGGDSPIYSHRDKITNPNCSFVYKTKDNHNGHYDYFLTDDALRYRSDTKDESFQGSIDKNLYMQHDVTFMNELHEFYSNTIKTVE